jgi:hypothetical protein
MKKIALGLIFLFTFFTGKSQNTPHKGDKKISFGSEFSRSIGTFSESNRFGIGASLQADYFVVNNISMNLSVSVLKFLGDSDGIPGAVTEYPDYNIMPTYLGTRYWFSEKLYGSSQIGLSFRIVRGINGSDFICAQGFGYQFTKKIDFQLKHNSIINKGGSLNNLTLRAAYTF